MPADISHLTSLFENATEGIILTDGRGNIALVNPAARKLFGYDDDELIGKSIEVLIPNKYQSHHHELRESFYKNPSNRVMGHGRDLHGRKKNGDEIPVEVSLSYYKKEGELFVIAFIVDISERKKAEQEMLEQKKVLEKISTEVKQLNTELEGKVEERTMVLKEALNKLEKSQAELSEALDKERELNEIKSRFVSMASHEFRTPLSAVLSSATLLAKYVTSDEQDKRDKHISRIKESVRHLNNILEDFLSLGKLNEGRVVTSVARFNLISLINDVCEEIRPMLKQGQDWVRIHEGDEFVQTDKNLLKNILINLIGNAVKFSGEGKVIRITSEVSQEHFIISVIDEGIGIPGQDLSHLFSSFFRAGNVTNIQGTGLGLHIVQRYLTMLGGQISVESELEKGSQFTISIPNQKIVG